MAKNHAIRLKCAVLTPAILILAASPAAAFKFELEDGTKGSFDTTVSYGLSQRISDRSHKLLGDENGGSGGDDGTLLNADDGNLNYNKRDVFSSLFKATHELGLKGNGWGGLLRASYLLDTKASNTRRTPLSDGAKSEAVKSFKWLDAFVYKDFYVGDQRGQVRVGNQVLSWGEDIFISGGINSINAYNLTRLRTPGALVKEALIPAPIVSGKLQLNDWIGVEGFYQFKWNRGIIEPAGSYFSSVDFVGPGARRFVLNGTGLPFATNVPENELDQLDLGAALGQRQSPKKTGQFGLAARFNLPDADAELGAYFISYHDKYPQLGVRADVNSINALSGLPGLATIEQYPERVRVFGLSFNKKVADIAFSGELSYRPNAPVALSLTDALTRAINTASADPTGVGTSDGFIRTRRIQLQFAAVNQISRSNSILGPVLESIGGTDATLIGEVAVISFPGLPNRAYSTPFGASNVDKTSLAYVLSGVVNYVGVGGLPLTLSPQVDYSHDFKGNTPGGQFLKGRRSLSLTMGASYLQNWRGAISYTRYSGAGRSNLLNDRDFFSASVSYSF
jgi:hypothetical protein